MRGLVVALAALSFVLGWLMPNHNFPWIAFENEAPIFVSLFLLAGVYWLDKGAEFSFPRGGLILFCLATVPLLQFALGQVSYFGDAYIAASYFGAGAVAYGVGYRATKVNGAIFVLQFVAWVFVFVASLSVWIALRQCLDLADSGFESQMKPWSRAGANLAQPNQLSSLLLIGFLSTLYLYRLGVISSITLWTLAIFVGFGIALAQSRFVLVALVVLFFFLSLRTGDAKKLSWKIRFFSLFLVLFAEWISWPYIVDGLTSGGVFTRETGDSLRLIILKELIDALLQRPVFGYGYNQIPIAQSLVAIAHPNIVYVSSSHNIVLDVLLWNGLIVGGSVLILTGVWLWRRLGARLDGGAWFALAIILVLLVHSLFEFPLHYAYFFLPLCFFAGTVEANVPWVKIVTLPRGFRVLIFAIGSFAIFSVLAEYPVAQSNLASARLLGSKVSKDDGLIDGLRLSGAETSYFLTQFNNLAILLSTPLYSDEMKLTSADLQVVASRYPIPDVLLRAAIFGMVSHDCRSAAKHICLMERFHGEMKSKAALNIVLVKNERGHYCAVDSLVNYCDE